HYSAPSLESGFAAKFYRVCSFQSMMGIDEPTVPCGHDHPPSRYDWSEL
ncbi:MAG: hypothetical protein JWO42_929, partial [Chloroflexi bacterium]|nr:hypothetical protein [Chloroflexota bacterium]